MTMAAAERTDFADLLTGLTAAQWEAPSLCGQWRVRDVAAHVTAYLDRSRAAFVGALFRAGLGIDRLNARDLSAQASGAGWRWWSA